MQAMQNQMKQKRFKRKIRLSNKDFGDFGSIFDNNLTHKVQRNKSPFVKKEPLIQDSPLVKNSNNDKSSQGSVLDSSIQSSGSSDYHFRLKGFPNKRKPVISHFEEEKELEKSV